MAADSSESAVVFSPVGAGFPRPQSPIQTINHHVPIVRLLGRSGLWIVGR